MVLSPSFLFVSKTQILWTEVSKYDPSSNWHQEYRTQQHHQCHSTNRNSSDLLKT